MTEHEARQVLLLQQVETGAATPSWTADDAAWATALSRQTAGSGAPFDRFVADRAGHALQRLLPRAAAARQQLQRPGWRPLWLPVALLVGLVAGLAADHIGNGQRINLLAPPVWALVAWNLAVYLLLLLPVGGVRRRIAALAQGLPAANPLALARVSLLLHVAALALALGLAGGMYLRGLVLEYRAGWQSTFLGAPLAQRLLDSALAPAAALTGIAVPDVAPLRAQPGPAAAWIHLYAATLLLAVVLPRALLASAAAWQAWRLRRHFPLPLVGAYFDRLRLAQHGGRMRVQLLPHGSPPASEAALRTLLAQGCGADVSVAIGAVTAYGDEDDPLPADPSATLHAALFDLAATPEAEAQGRFIARLPTPRLLLADESAFRRRFDAQRLLQRRAAWQALADAHATPFFSADFDRAGADDGERLRALLTR